MVIVVAAAIGVCVEFWRHGGCSVVVRRRVVVSVTAARGGGRLKERSTMFPCFRARKGNEGFRV